MKLKYLLLILGTIFISSYYVDAQIPYFAETVGNGNLYGYTSVKFRPGLNAQETYTVFQYGITDYFATGVDIYSDNNNVYWGVLFRGGYKYSKWYGIGLQVASSCDLGYNFRFSYATLGLYQNGALSPDGKLLWVSNTWGTINSNGSNSWKQWWYLGYCFDLKKCGSLTPMVGCLHDWQFNEKADLAIGAYYAYKKWNFYLWGNDFFRNNLRFVIGIDFRLI